MSFNQGITMVKTKGTKEQQARLAFLLDESQDTSEIVAFLQDLQLPDGGFPYKRRPGYPYSLSPTSMMMKIIAETKLNQTAVCLRTIRFVKSVQHPDGFWDENPAIKAYNPPFWNQPGELNTQLWITGALADTLTRLGEGASVEVRKARKFLLGYRQDDGRFKGPLITTWLAIAVFAPQRGVNDPIVTTALSILDQHTDWDGPDLSWALECLYWAGIPKDNPTATRLLSMLVKHQNPEGYWDSTDESTTSVQTTLQCLIVLKQFDFF